MSQRKPFSTVLTAAWSSNYVDGHLGRRPYCDWTDFRFPNVVCWGFEKLRNLLTKTGTNIADYSHVGIHDDHDSKQSTRIMSQLVQESFRKIDGRKDVSVAFQTKLNKIEEVEETVKNSRGRPKSATLFPGTEPFKTDSRRRSKSTEPVRKQKKPFEIRECCCCCRKCFSLSDFDSRSSSGLDEPWISYRFARTKCRSEPCFQKFRSDKELHKMKRSLRLLGFDLSDFGIQLSRLAKTEKEKLERSSSFSTKITDRSMSLESLRATIKQAWLDDSLDEKHRRLLAQAAYEEWYFKKERESWKKKEEERILRLKAQENLRVDFLKKKEKSEEEFQKWLRRKKMKRKENKENVKTPFRVTKTKEESEEAFLKWKKSKEEELEKKKKAKKKEEEKRKESEKQKTEKKLIAEKAFQQWKAKLEEAERLKEAKREKRKKKLEAEVRKRRENESQICFQTWKAAKDEEIRDRMKRIREAERTEREKRLTRMEERMYEAEQAFEDWLEKVDLRRRKYSGTNAYEKIIPWIPA